ncbi:hypothetical protein AB1Y20_012194 [Prymnesium parvum]|uniref:PSI domain-containing protein n=1 Tax=Prymnesium parvum TaxID=97485 RepID=A0AB34INU2_PRYPA
MRLAGAQKSEAEKETEKAGSRLVRSLPSSWQLSPPPPLPSPPAMSDDLCRNWCKYDKTEHCESELCATCDWCADVPPREASSAAAPHICMVWGEAPPHGHTAVQFCSLHYGPANAWCRSHLTPTRSESADGAARFSLFLPVSWRCCARGVLSSAPMCPHFTPSRPPPPATPPCLPSPLPPPPPPPPLPYPPAPHPPPPPSPPPEAWHAAQMPDLPPASPAPPPAPPRVPPPPSAAPQPLAAAARRGGGGGEAIVSAQGRHAARLTAALGALLVGALVCAAVLKRVRRTRRAAWAWALAARAARRAAAPWRRHAHARLATREEAAEEAAEGRGHRGGVGPADERVDDAVLGALA